MADNQHERAPASEGLLRVWDLLLKKARRLLGSREDAEDVRQEVARKALEKPALFAQKDAEHRRAYLLAATRNEAIEALRHDGAEAARRRKLPTEEEAAAPESPVEAKQASRMFCQILREAVMGKDGKGGLSPVHRSVFLLRYSKNLEYPRIAELLGVPVGTVKSRLHACHALLYERMRELQEELPLSGEEKELFLLELQQLLATLGELLEEEDR